jgi:hypothetical protein
MFSVNFVSNAVKSCSAIFYSFLTYLDPSPFLLSEFVRCFCYAGNKWIVPDMFIFTSTCTQKLNSRRLYESVPQNVLSVHLEGHTNRVNSPRALSVSWCSLQASNQNTLRLLFGITPIAQISGNEVSLCVVCMSTIVAFLCYCIKHSVALGFVLKCHVTVTHWNKFSCTLPMWKVGEKFGYEFQDVQLWKQKEVFTQ